MAKLGWTLFMLLLLGVLGVLAYLTFWDIQPERRPVEVYVPSERLAP